VKHSIRPPKLDGALSNLHCPWGRFSLGKCRELDGDCPRSRLSLGIGQEPGGDEDDEDIGQNVGAVDASVTTTRRIVDTDSSHEGIARGVRTIVAVSGGVRIDKIRALRGCECAGVFLTCLAVGGGERIRLVVATSDGNTVQSLGDHTGNQESEGVDVVEELVVENVQLRPGDGNTAKKREDNQEEGVEQGGDEDRGTQGGDSLTKSDRENFRDEHHCELVSLPAGRLAGSPNREVPASERDQHVKHGE
jgi:hypothetical protein